MVAANSSMICFLSLVRFALNLKCPKVEIFFPFYFSVRVEVRFFCLFVVVVVVFFLSTGITNI